MMSMHDIGMRTIIDIPEEVVAILDEVGIRTKRSRASLIRDAVSAYLKEVQCEQSKAAFGIWKSREVDGMTYQNKARGDWAE